MPESETIQITKWHLIDSMDTKWHPKFDQYSQRRVTNRNTASLSTGHDCSKRGASIAIKTVSSGTGRDARADVVRGVRNSGASVSRLIFISPLATLRGWRAEVADRWVSADLTRGTNKFDGTPIRNSTYLSMGDGFDTKMFYFDCSQNM